MLKVSLSMLLKDCFLPKLSVNIIFYISPNKINFGTASPKTQSYSTTSPKTQSYRTASPNQIKSNFLLCC